MAWPLPTAPAEAEKKVNGDFVLRPKLMNNPVIIGKNTAGMKIDTLLRGLAFYNTPKNMLYRM